MREPSDLSTQEDGTEETKLRKEKSHLFETASSSFFAYLPISFRKNAVAETNEYATQKKGALISLDELLKFFGIMFYMTVIVKGEYSNYWGNQVESEILGISGEELGLDKLMTLKRFQFIRQCLCFRSTVSQDELRKDPAARIVLSSTCSSTRARSALCWGETSLWMNQELRVVRSTADI
jgi:hypothetical protein